VGRQRALGDDFRGDAADAATCEADGAGSTRGEVEHTAANERAAVIDGDDDALAAMCDAQLGAERQRTVRRGHGVLVEALARGSLAAGLVAVKGRDAGEAAAGAGGRRHRRIGVAASSTHWRCANRRSRWSRPGRRGGGDDGDAGDGEIWRKLRWRFHR